MPTSNSKTSTSNHPHPPGEEAWLFSRRELAGVTNDLGKS